MSRRPLALLPALAVLLLAVGLAGCGKEKTTTFADNEGIYLDVGPLAYQIQISRQLNPTDIEDRNYFAGMDPAQVKLTPDEVWFGVFMRVQNTSKQSQPAANDFEITDTLERVYTPVPIPRTNPFAYKARDVGPGQLLPSTGSAAGSGPVGQGALLLFKLKLTSFANRPLELRIKSRSIPRETAHAELDL
ncbi:MAG: hypothetical protein DLM61_27020 [Pseudonocardiales bacterium]|nr:MAG: hypothetical protein DLM61_27020 [Pseudonocardiales bacterium]